MKLVALISGGKDSCYNMMQCVGAGHEIVALAHLKPKEKDELDSFMYQCIGHNAIELYSEAMGLPLYQGFIEGGSVCQGRDYIPTPGDEVEDLYNLLSKVKDWENIEGVASGAILSNYQRVRVENVCSRLGLTSFAYLWRRNQEELLSEMITCQVRAIIVKVATLGLKPSDHLGKEISEMFPHLIKMKKQFGMNVCGEGGEYETFTLDCPLFKKRLVVDEEEIVIPEKTNIAPVGYIKFKRLHLEDKPGTKGVPNKDRLESFNILGPTNFLLDLKVDFNDEEISPIVEDPNYSLDCGEESDERLLNVRPTFASSASGFFSVSDIVGANGNPTEEMRLSLSVMQDLLLEKDLWLSDLIAVQLFVRDMNQFKSINEAYKEFFHLNPPSRVCVQVQLPQNASFSFSCTGFSQKIRNLDESSGNLVVNHMHIQGVSHWAPANIGPYSQAVQVNELIYVAGQIGLVPGTMNMIKGGIKAESYMALRSTERVLDAMESGTSLMHVIACVCYVTNSQYILTACKVWNERCGTVGDKSAGPFVNYVTVPALPRGAKVEWHVVAHSQRSDSWTWNRQEKICIDGVTIELTKCSFGETIDVGEGFIMAQFVLQNDQPALTSDTLEKLLLNVFDLVSQQSTNAAIQINIYYTCTLINRRMIQEGTCSSVVGVSDCQCCSVECQWGPPPLGKDHNYNASPMRQPLCYTFSETSRKIHQRHRSRSFSA